MQRDGEEDISERVLSGPENDGDGLGRTIAMERCPAGYIWETPVRATGYTDSGLGASRVSQRQ